MYKMNEEAFTLLEIILVIAIIGILITTIAPNFGRSQLSAKVSTHNSNVHMLKSAGALYLIDYPIEEKINIETELDIEGIKKYLDEETDIRIDPILKARANLTEDEYKIYITSNGNIQVRPGELIFEDDIIKEKAKYDS